jgi:asparagine synthase (glutamine-hydrolysing)
VRLAPICRLTAIRVERLHQLDLKGIAKERGLDFSYQPKKNGFEARLWAMRRIDRGNYNKGMLAGWGIDHRDPTADRRLVEYCLNAPMEVFNANGETRALAKRALRERVPQAVLSNRRRGYQAVDWHEALTANLGEIEAELNRLSRCAPAARTLDIRRLQGLVENWPSSGWEQQDIQNSYRHALLRGLSAGHFLRKVAPVNG